MTLEEKVSEAIDCILCNHNLASRGPCWDCAKRASIFVAKQLVQAEREAFAVMLDNWAEKNGRKWRKFFKTTATVIKERGTV